MGNQNTRLMNLVSFGRLVGQGSPAADTDTNETKTVDDSHQVKPFFIDISPNNGETEPLWWPCFVFPDSTGLFRYAQSHDILGVDRYQLLLDCIEAGGVPEGSTTVAILLGENLP